MASPIGRQPERPRSAGPHEGPSLKAEYWLPRLLDQHHRPVTTFSINDERVFPEAFDSDSAPLHRNTFQSHVYTSSSSGTSKERKPTDMSHPAGPESGPDVNDTGHASDSDGESIDVDSPSDGYFNRRAHPQVIFAQNPANIPEAKDKAEEAAGQHTSGLVNDPISRISSPAASVRSHTLSVDSSHLHTVVSDAGPAPPDYAAATAGRSAAQVAHHHEPAPITEDLSPVGPGNYGSFPPTFDDSGVEAGASDPQSPSRLGDDQLRPSFSPPGANQPTASHNRALTYGYQPQSMSDAEAQQHREDEETGLLSGKPVDKKSKRKCFGAPTRSCSKRRFITSIFLTIAVVLLIVFIAAVRSKDSDQSGGDDDDNKDGKVPPPSSPGLPEVPHPNLPDCTLWYYTSKEVFDFSNPQDFSVIERMDEPRRPPGDIYGRIHIRRAGKRQDVPIRVSVDMATSEHWSVEKFKYRKSHSGLILNTPNLETREDAYPGNHCIDVYIAVDILPGVTLSSLKIDTRHFSITVEEGIFDSDSKDATSDLLEISGESLLKTIAENVRCAYWQSRVSVIETVSGSITGTFALRDNLTVSSVSGDMTMDVDPKEISKRDPQPATFLLSTVSGIPKIHFPHRGYIPDRDYVTRVKSVSADISGSYILGSLTTLKSKGGAIRVDLLPFRSDDTTSKLESTTIGRPNKNHLLTPYNRAGHPWQGLQHEMASTSGWVTVLYPPEWTGTLDGTTVSGKMTVKGKGIKIIEDSRDFPWIPQRVVAKKGDGAAKLYFTTVSGLAYVQVGDD